MNQHASAALSVSGLDVSYGAVHAVRQVDLTVASGEGVAVIGSNGAGKSSMLRGIMGLVARSVARNEVFGQSVARMSTHRIARLGVGYVPEGRELFSILTVEEELLIGGRLLPRGECAEKLEEMFVLFPRLKERRTQITRTLSGGEQQMVAVARVLMLKPKLLLLDEPSLGLAPVIQDMVYDALSILLQNGMPILLVEQNAYRALKLCRRAYVLERGQVTRVGDSKDLIDDPTIRASYLGA